MNDVLCVLQTDPEVPGGPPISGVREQPGAGPDAGFAALEQSVLGLGPNAVVYRATGNADETLFVLAGHGALGQDDDEHPLEPESGAYVAAGHEYELRAGVHGMHLVCVRIPDPEPGGHGPAISRVLEQAPQPATTERQFRIVADPSTGLRSATHFIGYIPTTRAPDHFHPYDEVIYVLEGDGCLFAEGVRRPLGQGTCIGLPARLVHCLENTGNSTMRVQAVFRPAGSPAAAYYPDGRPAFPGLVPVESIRESPIRTPRRR